MGVNRMDVMDGEDRRRLVVGRTAHSGWVHRSEVVAQSSRRKHISPGRGEAFDSGLRTDLRGVGLHVGGANR